MNMHQELIGGYISGVACTFILMAWYNWKLYKCLITAFYWPIVLPLLLVIGGLWLVLNRFSDVLNLHHLRDTTPDPVYTELHEIKREKYVKFEPDLDAESIKRKIYG